jgi:hypothetical protein
MEWIQALKPTNETDKYLRIVLFSFLFLWNWLVSTRLETPFPVDLVNAYSIPLTRVGLIGLVLLSAYWCPSVGIMAAFAYVSLGADTLFFTTAKGV